MTQKPFPEGWDEERVQRVLNHYEAQTDDEAMGEDEAAWEDRTSTFVEIPTRLLPRVRELLAHEAE